MKGSRSFCLQRLTINPVIRYDYLLVKEREWALYRTIIWDWNGTLLDDVAFAVSLTNRVFGRWGIPAFESVDAYRAIFDFPVREYYRRAGVGDDIFDEVANAWASGYAAEFDCPLRADTMETVRRFKAAGFDQVIISASPLAALTDQVARYPELAGHLDRLMGLSHIYATSKVHLAQDYLKEMGLKPQEVILLGDTRHDHQVAEAVGCDCLLIADGHQPKAALESTGRKVMGSLREAADWILNA